VIFTAPSGIPVPDCWRTVKFGVRAPDQSTACGSIGASLSIEHAPCACGEIGRVFTHNAAEISVFEIDDGTVQVGLRLTLVYLGGQRRRRFFGLADDTR